MNKQRIRFIINPISGKKHRKDLPGQIERILDRAFISIGGESIPMDRVLHIETNPLSLKVIV